MTQYRIDTNEYLNSNKTIYEVVMLADAEGNVTGGGNFHGAAVDAFGRARFSEPVTLFDSTNLRSTNGKFSYSSTGAGANNEHYTNYSSVKLNVGTGANEITVAQTKRHFSYQPGKSLLIMSTFVFNEAKEGLTQRIGYFNTQDGIFLEQDDSNVYLVRRSYVGGSVTETRVAQTDWNGDTLDGTSTTSTSGVVLNLEKSQIFWMDIEWLGVGTVRCGFVINGQFIVAHSFHNANLNPSVYMTTANLPVRYEIFNGPSGTASPSFMQKICSAVISEGGYDARAIRHMVGTASLDGVSTTAKDVYINLVTIKLRDVVTTVVPAGADILNIANADFEWGLFFNATPATAFDFSTIATDAVAYSLEAKTFSDMGNRVSGGYMGGKTAPFSLGSGEFSWDFQMGVDLAGNYDTLTLAVRSTAQSKAAAGILNWYEL